MINQLVAALGQELGLTSKEIADAVWLALQMEVPEYSSNTVEKATRNQTQKRSTENFSSNRDPSTSGSDAGRDDFSKQSQSTDAELHTPDADSDGQGGFGSELTLNVPDARSLREPLSLAKSLKPLLKKVTAGVSTVLDDAATVERIADEGIWMPVLKPALEPWLDLALVVDESISMHLWQRTITELQRLLVNYGVFRDVRVWSLVTDDSGQVGLRPRLGAAARRKLMHRPSELIDPSGRRLILIATDCVSAIWQDGTMLPALKLWASSGPMAIMQMLPEWLWARTGLGFASAVRLHSLMPGVPNSRLDIRDLSPWDEVDLDTGIRVPVVTLEPEPFLAWSKMVSAKEEIWSAGFIFDLEAVASLDRPQSQNSSSAESAEQRVERFRATASPMARRLAGLLAAAPVIVLPIVRIIRDRLLPQSRQVHVAEVFLGGLLNPIFEINSDIDPNIGQYEFFNGVRELLLESVPTSDSVYVLEEISEFVADRLGLSLDSFFATLKNPNSSQDRHSVSWSRPFALVTAQILRNLGGRYAQFAEELELYNLSNIQPEQESQDREPSLDTPFPESVTSELANRISLLKWGNTQCYALQTNAPWNLPFDALIVPVGYRGTFGGLGDAFERFLVNASDRNLQPFSQLVFERMREHDQNHIKPHTPLLVPIPLEYQQRLWEKNNFPKDIFIICATVELSGNRELDSRQAAIAVESVIRIAKKQGLKNIVIPLLGAGRNNLPATQVAIATLKSVDQTLKALKNHGIKEITVVSRAQEDIDTISQISSQLDEYEFPVVSSGNMDFHIQKVKETIEKMFDGLIDLSDLQRSRINVTSLALLSRGLAAYSLHALANIDVNTAADSVVDGYSDNGIDALYVDKNNNLLWLVQSKWIRKGNGTPRADSLRKFKQGILDLLNERWNNFNYKLRLKEEDIVTALSSPGIKIKVVVAYTGGALSKHGQAILNELIQDLNDGYEIASYEVFNLERFIEVVENRESLDSALPSSTLHNELTDEPIFPLLEELPSGQVSIDSDFYVERPPIEENCYKTILRRGALIRIKASRQMGKTSLMSRILYEAQLKDCLTVSLNFQMADSKIFSDLDQFLKWFCSNVTRQLKLPNRLQEFWDNDILGSKDNCTFYFEDYILAEIEQPLVLGMDEVDLVFQHVEIASDFLGLLRGWYENSKVLANWRKLRIIVVHATEIYTPLNMNQSPFNVGLPIELPDFTEEQVLDLAKRHNLNWSLKEVRTFMSLVGGQPFLVRHGLHYLVSQRMTLEVFLENATSDEGIYKDHLQRQLIFLDNQPELVKAARYVMSKSTSVQVGVTQAFQLNSMGLVHLQGNTVTPKCELYRLFFRKHLN